MLQNRWVLFAFVFASILALRLLLFNDLNVKHQLLSSFLMAVFIVWLQKFISGPKIKKKTNPEGR
jgi:hypothetical protein